ncbi:hypothetical protein D0C36_20290 [Mucilaginibacter conchicola]|uniref:Uncharacterized protein n=1 Tax=Mucilaginibacter conchicola TaxID=2303333 RepID=A0A372NQR7_9SPHI|nr:hypothetical protein [Mucilaginibacter conchicola]RFZ91274.1 hypothetical protein D0C36_20290 [Mucilaginibacter conchicola]
MERADEYSTSPGELDCRQKAALLHQLCPGGIADFVSFLYERAELTEECSDSLDPAPASMAAEIKRHSDEYGDRLVTRVDLFSSQLFSDDVAAYSITAMIAYAAVTAADKKLCRGILFLFT